MIIGICDYCGKRKNVTLINYPMKIYHYISSDCKLKGLFLKGKLKGGYK